MMYPYIVLRDETEITHSHIIKVDDIQQVEVHFERPTEKGFNTARCILPSYTWIRIEGFTDKDIESFNEFLMHNAHLLYKYALIGGIQIA